MTEELHELLKNGFHVLEEEFGELDASFKVLLTQVEGPKGDDLSGMWGRVRSNFKDLFDKQRALENRNGND